MRIKRTGFGNDAGGTRGNSNIKSSPEEKAMKDTYNLSEFPARESFRRARQIGHLAGAPQPAWGEAQDEQLPAAAAGGLPECSS